MARTSTAKVIKDDKPKKTVVRKQIDIRQDPFYSEDFEVVDAITLNKFYPDEGNNKFYVAEVHRNKNGTEFRYYINYGKVGVEGAKTAQSFTTLDNALKEFNSKVNSKVRKGYVKIDLAVNARGSSANRQKVNVASLGSVAKNIKTEPSKLPKPIQDFVTKIYDEANQAVSMSISGSVKSDVQSPLGNLGVQGIQKGRVILGHIQRAIKLSDAQTVRNASIDYFKNIPRKLPRNLKDESVWLLSSQAKVAEELDVLDLYEDALRLLPVMGVSDIDAKFNALYTDMRVVDTKTLDWIKEKIRTTHASNHRFKLNVLNAFELNQKNAPQFDNSYGNVRHLFHGSRNANLVGILSSHLKMPNTLGGNIYKAGAMFGPGIYFASDSTKSANYSMANWGGKPNKYKTFYMFICEVALGRVHMDFSSNYHLSAPSGYDSVMGVGRSSLESMITRGEVPRGRGSSLINNEFIVYRENQARIKYIVELESK
ncbi:Poly(ADP-ribose) polymerase catalytic domain protein [compost metagenome]